jgi:hypothetical protein
MNRPQEIDILSRYSSDFISKINRDLSTLAEQIEEWTNELLATDDDLLLDSISAANIRVTSAISQLEKAAILLKS